MRGAMLLLSMMVVVGHWAQGSQPKMSIDVKPMGKTPDGTQVDV